MEHTPYPGNGTAPQARQVASVQSDSPTQSPIVYREGPPLYVADVHVSCPDDMDPATLTWADWHGDTDLYAAAYGAVVDVDDALFERSRFSQLGDGIAVNARRPVIRQCWFDDIYDDAIQLDHKWAATIEGCVLDGVHVGFSSRSSIEREPGQVVTITDTMVRLRSQYESYKPEKYGHDCHGPFFKWDPDVAVHLDEVWFYADQESSYGGDLGPPPICTGSTVHLCGTGAWSADAMSRWHQLAESGAITHLDVTSAAAWHAQLAAVRLRHPTGPAAPSQPDGRGGMSDYTRALVARILRATVSAALGLLISALVLSEVDWQVVALAVVLTALAAALLSWLLGLPEVDAPPLHRRRAGEGPGVPPGPTEDPLDQLDPGAD